MKDEVLQKALATDSAIIPRYDIILPNGTKVAENVQLILKNDVLTPGTLLNKHTLLKDATAAMYGMSADDALPDDVLVAIRNSAGYCPKLKVFSVPGATIFIQRVPEDMTASTYTVPTSGVLSIDIQNYGTYKLWSVINGTRYLDKYIDITETKQYSISFYSYVAYAKFTVTEEIGATILATHTDGSVSSGVVGADKTCTIALYKQGTWTCVATYAGVTAQTITFNLTASNDGSTIDNTPAWTKVKVQVTSGATVTLSRSGVTKSAVSVNGSCTFWLPDAEIWSAFASLGDKHVSGMATPILYGTKTIGLTL